MRQPKLICLAFGTLAMVACGDEPTTGVSVGAWAVAAPATVQVRVTNTTDKPIYAFACSRGFERLVAGEWVSEADPQPPECSLPGLTPTAPGASERYSVFFSELLPPGEYRVYFLVHTEPGRGGLIRLVSQEFEVR